MRRADCGKGTGLTRLRSRKEQPRNNALGQAGDEGPQACEPCCSGLWGQGLGGRLSSAVYTPVLCPNPVQVRAEGLGGVEIQVQLERASPRKTLRWQPTRLIVKNTGLVVFSRDINPVYPASKLDFFAGVKAQGNGRIGP